MKYKFKIREIEPIGATYMKYSSIVTKANKVFSNVFKTIEKKISKAQLFNYLSMYPQAEFGTIKLCVPIKAGLQRKSVGIKELYPNHIGSYEILNNTYFEIEKHAQENSSVLGTLLKRSIKELETLLKKILTAVLRKFKFYRHGIYVCN